MNKPYTCVTCEEELEARPDEDQHLVVMGITVVLVECTGCGEIHWVDILEDAKFISIMPVVD